MKALIAFNLGLRTKSGFISDATTIAAPLQQKILGAATFPLPVYERTGNMTMMAGRLHLVPGGNRRYGPPDLIDSNPTQISEDDEIDLSWNQDLRTNIVSKMFEETKSPQQSFGFGIVFIGRPP